MKADRTLLLAVAMMGCLPLARTWGQEIVYQRPVTSAVVSPPVVVMDPVLPAPPAGVVVQRPVTGGAALVAPSVPRPIVVQRPVPVAPPPVTVYRPFPPAAVVAPPPVAAPPVVTYSPVVGSVVPAAPVVVRPKVYVPGQPIRNLLRAITP